MSRDIRIIAIVFFVLMCAILLRLDDVIYAVQSGKIIVVRAEKYGKQIEGEFTPVEG
jgi:hypothetical protein